MDRKSKQRSTSAKQNIREQLEEVIEVWILLEWLNHQNLFSAQPICKMHKSLNLARPSRINGRSLAHLAFRLENWAWVKTTSPKTETNPAKQGLDRGCRLALPMGTFGTTP